MSPRYLWWRSCYDGVVHAFSIVPGTALQHQHYYATCAHAAPPDLASMMADEPRCPLCLLILGTE
jgi:hypothetical protein